MVLECSAELGGKIRKENGCEDSFRFVIVVLVSSTDDCDDRFIIKIR